MLSQYKLVFFFLFSTFYLSINYFLALGAATPIQCPGIFVCNENTYYETLFPTSFWYSFVKFTWLWLPNTLQVVYIQRKTKKLYYDVCKFLFFIIKSFETPEPSLGAYCGPLDPSYYDWFRRSHESHVVHLVRSGSIEGTFHL